MMTVGDLAMRLRDDAERGTSKHNMLKLVRQFVMDADRSSNPSSLLEPEPATTGDVRWDALVTGVCEDIAVCHGLAIPEWVSSREPLEEWWFVTNYAGLHPIAFVETPPAIARHGVFIRRASLENV